MLFNMQVENMDIADEFAQGETIIKTNLRTVSDLNA
jgi:hypothetical protein